MRPSVERKSHACWSAFLTELGLFSGGLFLFIIVGDSGKCETGYADAQISKK